MAECPEKPPRYKDASITPDPSRTEVSSPPCSLAEVDPAYSGFLSWQETINNLNMLLEAERAGSRTCRLLRKQATEVSVRRQLLETEHNEDYCCGMLARHISRFGGVPSRKTGAFYDKIRATSGIEARLVLLARGQKWVAEYLKEMLPKIGDDHLYNDLQHMLKLHT